MEGEVMIQELKISLDKKNMVNLQDNQKRSVFYLAKEKLREFIKVSNLFKQDILTLIK